MRWYSMVKKIVMAVILGVGVGCFAFMVALFAGSAAHGGANAFVSAETGEGLLRIAVFCIIFGTSSTMAGLIYEVKNLAVSLKAVFQMTITAFVYFAGAYFCGWIERNGVMLYICSALGIAVGGWLLSMAMFLIDVEIINRRIRDKNSNIGDGNEM